MSTCDPSSQLLQGGLTAVPGFFAAGLSSGIKKGGLADLALIYADTPCRVAGLFTQNQFCAAPLQLNKRHLEKGLGRAIVVNSGNANAFTGAQGMRDAEAMARAAAQSLGLPVDAVYVASTGVIGERLPLRRILEAVPKLCAALSDSGSAAAAKAIMTTDTFQKETAWEASVGAQRIRVGGIAKGSGMIHPNMATMLAFLATDVAMETALLQDALREAVNYSFNCVTIDGDTSTSDMALLFANGKKGHLIRTKDLRYRQFVALLKAACLALAKMLVRDGEGATKLIAIEVSGAKDRAAAQKIASSIARSLLVKTAFFGEDANWGRIVAAIGNAQVPVLEKEVDLSFGPTQLLRGGAYLGRDAEASVSYYLKRGEIELHVGLRSGEGSATVWTSDLSFDYVKINASYRS